MKTEFEIEVAKGTTVTVGVPEAVKLARHFIELIEGDLTDAKTIGVANTRVMVLGAYVRHLRMEYVRTKKS